MKIELDDIKLFIEKNRYEMLLFWESLVNIQGGSYEIDNVNRVMNFLKKHFDQEGIACRLVDTNGGANVLIAELNPEVEGAPILFTGHCDTVFPDGSYPEDPFYIEDGIAHGPGVCDMKQGVAETFFLFVALKHFGYKERHVKVIFVPDEEISHVISTADEILMNEARGSLCCFNMETGRMDNCLTVGRKGGMDCHITVHGVAAHAGNDYLTGRNAIIEMAQKLPLVQGLTKYDEGLTISTGVIKGGMVSNSVPNYCYAELDIRYAKLEHMDYVKKKILEICQQTFIEGTTTEVEFVAPMPAFEETEANHKLLAYINSRVESMGMEPFKPIYVGGMSDASYIGAVGVPTVCSMGGRGSGNHTKNEVALVDSFFERFMVALVCCLEIKDYTEQYA